MTKEYCSKCGELIGIDDWITDTNKCEYWGSPCEEVVVIGYICSNCNHKEEW